MEVGVSMEVAVTRRVGIAVDVSGRVTVTYFVLHVTVVVFYCNFVNVNIIIFVFVVVFVAGLEIE